jgi:hypothetical protein
LHRVHDARGEGGPRWRWKADQDYACGLAVCGEDKLPEVLVFGEQNAAFLDRKRGRCLPSRTRARRVRPNQPNQSPIGHAYREPVDMSIFLCFFDTLW